MTPQIGTLLEQHPTAGLVGRQRELALLGAMTQRHDGTVLILLHGLAGVGKSTILDAFTAQARVRGVIVIRVDCRGVEPTERGFLHEMGAALGISSCGIVDVTDRLAGIGERVLLALDNYEVFRLLDSWLRTTFLPVLGDNVRVVLAGRDPPVPAWLTAPRWQGRLRSVTVEPLDDVSSMELLRHYGVDALIGHRINRIARGHPLVLCLAAAAVAERPDLSLDEAATQPLIGELTRLYLADVHDR